MYLAGGCTVPGPGGVPGLGGVCTWSGGGTLGGVSITWSQGVPGRGGVPGLVGGCTWSGTPPCEQNDKQV